MNRKPRLYTDVAEAAADLCDDPGVADRIRERRNQRREVFALLSLRCGVGLDLDEFARRMGVSRADLERIEEGTDADLSPRMIADYLAAVASALPRAVPATPPLKRATAPRKRATSRKGAAKPERRAAVLA